MSVKLSIVPVGKVDKQLLEYLSLILGEFLGFVCSVEKKIKIPSSALDYSRGQYCSHILRNELIVFDSSDIILGITGEDIFVPVLTFVFGEAEMRGRTAIVSTHRLRQKFYGLFDDRELLFKRCEKEAIHELGHIFGLKHCRKFDCVMHHTYSVESIDLKRREFCPSCVDELRESEDRGYASYIT